MCAFCIEFNLLFLLERENTWQLQNLWLKTKQNKTKRFGNALQCLTPYVQVRPPLCSTLQSSLGAPQQSGWQSCSGRGGTGLQQQEKGQNPTFINTKRMFSSKFFKFQQRFVRNSLRCFLLYFFNRKITYFVIYSINQFTVPYLHRVIQVTEARLGCHTAG